MVFSTIKMFQALKYKSVNLGRGPFMHHRALHKSMIVQNIES